MYVYSQFMMHGQKIIKIFVVFVDGQLKRCTDIKQRDGSY